MWMKIMKLTEISISVKKKKTLQIFMFISTIHNNKCYLYEKSKESNKIKNSSYTKKCKCSSANAVKLMQ